MSDASLLAWTGLAIVIALVVGFFVVLWSIVPSPQSGADGVVENAREAENGLLA